MRKYPKTMGISLNAICNLKCKMCDIGQQNAEGKFYKTFKKGGDLSLVSLQKITDEIRGQKISISFNGTEPLLYPNLGEALSFFSNRPVSITTNGFLLEEKSSEIIANGVKNVCISLDGTREIHDYIRGVDGSFVHAVAGMKILQQNGVKVRIALAVSNLNSSHIWDAIKKFDELGANNITISHLNFVTPQMADLHNKLYSDMFGEVSPSSLMGVDPSLVDTKKLYKYLENESCLLNIKKSGKRFFGDMFINFIPCMTTQKTMETYYKHPLTPVGPYRCYVAKTNMQILSNGDVIPAGRCFDKPMGNIHKNTVGEIWSGKEFNAFRKNIKKVGATPACLRCCGLFGRRGILG